MKTKFIKAVDEGDIISTRLFISNEILLDPRGKSFHEMIDFAESKLPNLYDSHDGKYYSTTEEKWDESFLFSIKNDLDTNNFSQDRLSFYERVAKVVLKEKAENLDREEIASESAKGAYNPGVATHNGANSRSQSQKKKLYEGIAAGGAIMAIAGLCVSKASIAIMGLTCLTIGSVLLYKEIKK